ncbi:unnamed protein product [Microthlaspi erraticum]|uniref:NAC domain-containing protein n=1 Tax=Microthlaspi erraticum TaxID=1685480 RepID=A0A6D2KC71_9BRAS|nr:unnamed protein product [Microthlaspi erraticum]
MDIYPCVRFAPTDEEVITFLQLRVQGIQVYNCLIMDQPLYQFHPVHLPHFNTYFMRPGEFWYFVTRPTRGPLNRIVNRNVGNHKWVKSGRKTLIREGNIVIGHKQKLAFRDNNGVSTGWQQFEFTLESEQFQPQVVSHLIYRLEDDDTIAAVDNLIDLPLEEAADDNLHFQQILNGYQQVLGM